MLLVLLEGERRYVPTRVKAEATVVATGDATDVVPLHLSDDGPVLTVAGVRKVPPAPEGV